VVTAPPFAWGAALRALARPGPPPPRWLLAVGLGLAADAAGIALTMALGVIYFGRASRYFAEARLGTYLSVLALFGCAAVAWRVYRRLGPAPFRRFWAVTAVGFVYLGLDDWIMIHENLDLYAHLALGLDPRNPITDPFDDIVIIGYAGVAAAFAWRYRVELLRLRWMVLTLVPAFVAFVVMLVYDMTGWSTVVEESAKLVSGTLILLAFLAADWDPALAGVAGAPGQAARETAPSSRA
jgi:hypothetical protein